jgi:hypothetical protein
MSKISSSWAKSNSMTVEYFNSLSLAEQEHLVLHKAILVKATVDKEKIHLICDLDSFRFAAYLDLETNYRSFSALGIGESGALAQWDDTSLISSIHNN